jgi:hypothetical protein
VIFSLSAYFDQAKSPSAVKSGIGKHFEEVGLADVVGTRAGDEQTARTEHFQSAKVELLIAAEGRIQIALGLGEGRRIENDRIVAALRRGIVLKQVEGVGFNPFDFAMVECGVLIGDFQGRTGTVDASDV